jgi:GntR family transcriptional regulator/MocR family aminotransferase
VTAAEGDDGDGREARGKGEQVPGSGAMRVDHAVAHLPVPLGEQAVVSAARARSIGLYGMGTYRSDGAATPAQLVLGFGNLGDRPIQEGIAAIGDLLRRRPP